MSAATAYERLVEPHIDALLRTARRLTRDEHEAEDLVQEALLKGLRFFESFRHDSNFKAWIFKILMNTFVNRYRRRRKFGGDVGLESVPEEAIRAADDVDERFARDGEKVFELVDERIRQALDDLPEHLRTVFLLSAVEGLKYREIAEALDCPVGTIMSRLVRGRAMLKDRLWNLAKEEGFLREQLPDSEEQREVP